MPQIKKDIVNQNSKPATSEQLIQLNLLSKQIKTAANSINRPVSDLFATWVVNQARFSMLSFVSTQIIDRYIPFITARVSIKLLMHISALFKLMPELSNAVNNAMHYFFPNGIVYFYEKEIKIEELQVNLTKKNAKKMLEELQEYANKIDSTANKIEKNKLLIMMGGLVLTYFLQDKKIVVNGIYIFGEGARSIITYAMRKYEKYSFKNNLQIQKNELKKISLLDNNWMIAGQEKPETATFKLEITNKNLRIFFEGKEDIVGLPVKKYLSELKYVLEKSNWPVLDVAKNEIVVGYSRELNGVGKLKKLKSELHARLLYIKCALENHPKKYRQLVELANATGVNTNWYYFDKKNSEGLHVYHYANAVDEISETVKNKLIKQLKKLYGEDNVIEEQQGILVKGTKVADVVDLEEAKRQLAQKKSSSTSKLYQLGNVGKGEEAAKNKLEKQEEKKEDANTKKVMINSAKTLEDIAVELKQNPADMVYPMFVPWARPGTYFSTIDPRLAEQLSAEVLNGLVMVASSGNVKGKGDKTKSSCTAIVPNSQAYTNVVGEQQIADFKAKRTNNLRFFAVVDRRQMVDDQPRVVVSFNGFSLGHT